MLKGLLVLPTREIVFKGRTCTESKRQVIRYWSLHRQELDMKLSDFLKHCVIMDDQRTIVFKM